jgi:hypothetical protein
MAVDADKNRLACGRRPSQGSTGFFSDKHYPGLTSAVAMFIPERNGRFII